MGKQRVGHIGAGNGHFQANLAWSAGTEAASFVPAFPSPSRRGPHRGRTALPQQFGCRAPGGPCAGQPQPGLFFGTHLGWGGSWASGEAAGLGFRYFARVPNSCHSSPPEAHFPNWVGLGWVGLGGDTGRKHPWQRPRGVRRQALPPPEGRRHHPRRAPVPRCAASCSAPLHCCVVCATRFVWGIVWCIVWARLHSCTRITQDDTPALAQRSCVPGDIFHFICERVAINFSPTQRHHAMFFMDVG